jgi:translation elongation factor EF-Tu-like GTPase
VDHGKTSLTAAITKVLAETGGAVTSSARRRSAPRRSSAPRCRSPSCSATPRTSVR